jgi:hypothetical protein
MMQTFTHKHLQQKIKRTLSSEVAADQIAADQIKDIAP